MGPARAGAVRPTRAGGGGLKGGKDRLPRRAAARIQVLPLSDDRRGSGGAGLAVLAQAAERARKARGALVSVVCPDGAIPDAGVAREAGAAGVAGEPAVAAATGRTTVVLRLDAALIAGWDGHADRAAVATLAPVTAGTS